MTATMGYYGNNNNMNDKIVINGCDLLNRRELSSTQDRELQRYLDGHSLQYADRPQPEPPKKKQTYSAYSNLRDKLASRESDWGNSRPDSAASGRRSEIGYYYHSNLGSPRSGNSPYPRKEVSWSDVIPDYSQQRARSTSPKPSSRKKEMTQYGSAGNLSYGRDGVISPAYSLLDRHSDDYNRYETTRHIVHRQRQDHPDDEGVKFSGYGDRAGSGVELFPVKWQGGEIIRDRRQMPKSLKPRRFYYSPIGDGVVAADGIEMKRVPVEQEPRVTVSRTRQVEGGSPGQAGHNLYSKIWTDVGSGENGGGFGAGELGGGGGSGRNSRAGAGSGMSPGGGSGYGGGDPYGTMDSNRSGGGRYGDLTMDSTGRGGGVGGAGGGRGGGHQSGSSLVSSLNLDRSRKYEAQTDYLITNPRELIHQYATTTPVAVMSIQDDVPSATKTTTYYRKTTEESTEYAPYPPYRGSGSQKPGNFVKQLRDEGLTVRQKAANLHTEPVNQKDSNTMSKIEEIRYQTQTRPATHHQGIDHLTEKMVHSLQTGHPTPPKY